VRYWITENEPNAFAFNTCLLGVFPPRLGPHRYPAVVRHLVAAHQAAYEELKRTDPGRQVSANVFHWHPRDGGWPRTADLVARLEALDYVSFDYYFAFQLAEVPRLAAQWEWPVYPEGLGEAVASYWSRFRKPILIAENGFCTRDDVPRKDGWTRERFLVHHLDHLLRAVEAGADVLGYLHWSLIDNWELGSFAPRFGLYRIDYADPSLPRLPTPAVDTYREIARSGGISDELARRHGLCR
jgi:beta-glucosidase